MASAEKKRLCMSYQTDFGWHITSKDFWLLWFLHSRLWDYPDKIFEFILNSIEKVKPGFSLSSMFMFPESDGTKRGYIADQNRPRGGHHENEFWQFSNAKISFLNR